MVFRSAFLGLLIALVIMVGLFYPKSNQRLADRLSQVISLWSQRGSPLEGTGSSLAGVMDLPPALFPAFPEGERTLPKPPRFVPGKQRVRVRKLPEHQELVPGSAVRFSIVVENSSEAPLHMLSVEERFDDHLLTVEDAGGGTIARNAILWMIPDLDVGEQWSAEYISTLAKGAMPSNVETTVFVSGEELEQTASAPRLATSFLTVVALPRTGVDLPWWALGWAALIP